MASASSATHTTTASASKSDPGPTTVYETFTISGAAPSTSTRIITPDSTQTSVLGPLTTTFTPPSRCSQAYWISDSSRIYDPTLGQVCATVDGEIAYSQDTACLPPVKSTILGSLVGSSDVLYTTYDYQGYYSPGIACPAGYSTACAAQAGTDGIQSALSNFQSFGFVYSATANETVVGCCPTGYQCTAILSSQWCQHVLASTTQPLVTCVNGAGGDAPASTTTPFILPTNVTLSATDTLLSTEVTSTIKLTTLTMLATMIQINFQVTDLASTSSSLSTSLPTTTTDAYPTSTGDSSSGSSSNHKTTTIAVSVVIPCVAIFAAALLGWFLSRRRAKKQLSASYQAAQSTEPEPSNSHSYYGTGTSEPSEMLGSPSRVEMEGSPVMYEMAGTDPNTVAVRHEMYAGK